MGADETARTISAQILKVDTNLSTVLYTRIVNGLFRFILTKQCAAADLPYVTVAFAIAMLRLAATNAAHSGAKVVHSIYTIAGTTGIYQGTRIGQALQDALVIPQHAFMSEATWQHWGASLLGVPPAGL